MKKFDIKWILILVLVVILAFGLVACGNKGGGGSEEGGDEPDTPVVDPNKSTPSEFFGALWESSKSIGATTVNPNTDKVHIGLAMDLSLTSNDVAELDVGIEFGIVADLAAMNKTSNPDLGDTALMLKAFDKVTGENWITLWYFLTDKDNIYLEVQKQAFKVSFDAYWNNEFSTLLRGVLADDLPFLAKGPIKNLLGIINGIAASGGSNWSLDTLVLGNKSKGGDFDGLLAVFGLNLSEILENETVKSILGKNTDTSSLGSILQSMGGVVLDSSGCRKETVNGRTVYTASKLSKTATTLLNGFTNNLFNSISALSLSFGVKDNKIDGLTIGIAGKKDLNNAEIKINITDLTIEKATNDTAKNVFGVANKAFKPYAKIAWEGYMDASAWGVKINPNDTAIKIGKVKANLDATIDLVGAGNANATAAQLVITHDVGQGAEKLLTVVYKDGTLTLETDLTKANNQAIAKAALYPLAKLIEKAAVGEVPYAIFKNMATEVLDEMFTYDVDDNLTGVNGNFTTISITGVDIATLAKGAFYAIFSGFATGSNDEKPGEAVTKLTTYDGASYIYKSKEYTKGQYAWSLDIAKTAGAVLKAIKYSGTAAQKDKDYSIELSSIAATLKGVFTKATVESVDKSAKADVTAPASVDEMMALFMCTNDGIILDLTRHGLLPLYNANGITDKYIGEGEGKLSEAAAIDEHYYAMPGKAITKNNAKAIWAFLTGNGTTALTLTDITVGTYYDIDGDKDGIANYVQNSAIAWFVKFITGTELVSGKTAANVVEALTGTNSGIKITLNRATGGMTCDIKLDGKSTTGYINYTISGTETAYVPTASLVGQTNDDYMVEVELDDAFYALFKANFGMGPTTSLANGHGINNDLYIFANTADYENGAFTAIDYMLAAIIRSGTATAPIYYLVTEEGMEVVTVDIQNGIMTVSGATDPTYNGEWSILGNAYKVIVERTVNP